MDQLAPVIYQLQDRTARLAMAVGTVRYLSETTTVEDGETVNTAIQVLDHLARELSDALGELRGIGARLEAIAEEPFDVPLESGCIAAYPSPDYTGVEIDLGEICISAPSTGPALDELLESITAARQALAGRTPTA